MMEYKRLTERRGDLVIDKCGNCDNVSSPQGCTEHCCYEVMKNRLAELEDKIEQGTLIELPCILVGNGAIDAFGKVRVPYYQVLWLDEFGFMKVWRSTDEAEAEKRLKELQE